MGSLDWKVSALGFGAMRLPVIPIKDEDKGEMISNELHKRPCSR